MIKNMLEYIKRNKVITSFIIIVVIGIGIAIPNYMKKTPNISIDKITNKELASLNLEEYNRLLIVAHPEIRFLKLFIPRAHSI